MGADTDADVSSVIEQMLTQKRLQIDAVHKTHARLLAVLFF